MNFIDIASWQKGINLPALFRDNPSLDGVIVKLTQGTDYTNPEAKGWLDWLKSHDKPFGTYHYLDGSGAKREAQHYAEAVKAYPGGVLALDYEGTVLAIGTSYLKAALDEVTRLTGVKPLVYCSLSVVSSQDFKAIAETGYRLWVAQYADMQEVKGFLTTPWQRGSVEPFSGYAMHQYTSCGCLSGWGGHLDFDQFRDTAEDWLSLTGFGPEPDIDVLPKGPDPVVVSEVLAGRYGSGAERAAKLNAAGYAPEEVQAKVNELYGVAQSCKKYVSGNEQYINSICKITKLL